MNGLGNAANSGGAGGVSSLRLTAPGGWSGWISDSSSPGLEANQGFLSAIDPGAIAAWSAGSGYGPGTLTAYSGTLSFDFYGGNFTDWNWFDVTLNYNGHWDNFWASTSSNFTGADGQTGTHFEVPYTISAVNAGLSYLGLGIAENAGNIRGQTFSVDNFQVAAVPEPGTAALMVVGARLSCSCAAALGVKIVSPVLTSGPGCFRPARFFARQFAFAVVGFQSYGNR